MIDISTASELNNIEVNEDNVGKEEKDKKKCNY